MFFNKNKEEYKLLIEGFTIVDGKKYEPFIIEKLYKNRIKLNAFLLRLKTELSKFNKEFENNKLLSREEIQSNYSKMYEFYQNEDGKNYMFYMSEGKEKIIDNVEFGVTSVYNKKGKLIFNKNFSNIDNKDMEI